MVRPVRFHARYNCEISVEIHAQDARRWAKPLGLGRIVNISMGGFAVITPYKLNKGIAYEFRFSYAGEDLRLTGRMVWERPLNPKDSKSGGYGISCTLSVRQEKSFKTVVDKIRAEQTPSADDRLRNYWNS